MLRGLLNFISIPGEDHSVLADEWSWHFFFQEKKKKKRVLLQETKWISDENCSWSICFFCLLIYVWHLIPFSFVYSLKYLTHLHRKAMHEIDSHSFLPSNCLLFLDVAHFFQCHAHVYLIALNIWHGSWSERKMFLMLLKKRRGAKSVICKQIDLTQVLRSLLKCLKVEVWAVVADVKSFSYSCWLSFVSYATTMSCIVYCLSTRFRRQKEIEMKRIRGNGREDWSNSRLWQLTT